VRKRDRSEEVDHAAGKVVFPVGAAPLCCVCIRRMVSKRARGHARTTVACEHAGQRAAVGGWAGGRGSSARRVGAAATAQPPSSALGSFLPVGCRPWARGLVLAMSFERTGLPCVLIHFPLHPPTCLVAHCW
jgi:hypothetical protein